MSKWFGPFLLALALMFVTLMFGRSAIEPTAAAASQATPRQQATFSPCANC